MAGGKYHTWVASVMPSISHVLTHLSHRHPLRWAALQENFMVQGHFLAQRLLIKVLAQVWEKGKGSTALSGQGREEAGRQSWILKCPILATRWQWTPRKSHQDSWP